MSDSMSQALTNFFLDWFGAHLLFWIIPGIMIVGILGFAMYMHFFKYPESKVYVKYEKEDD